MSIKSFLKEDATWESRGVEPNEYGDYEYLKKEIKCKIEEERKIVASPQGEQFLKYSRFFVLEPVQEGDKLNNLTVSTVKPIKDGRRIEYYEVIAT